MTFEEIDIGILLPYKTRKVFVRSFFKNIQHEPSKVFSSNKQTL